MLRLRFARLGLGERERKRGAKRLLERRDSKSIIPHSYITNNVLLIASLLVSLIVLFIAELKIMGG